MHYVIVSLGKLLYASFQMVFASVKYRYKKQMLGVCSLCLFKIPFNVSYQNKNVKILQNQFTTIFYILICTNEKTIYQGFLNQSLLIPAKKFDTQLIWHFHLIF